MRRLQTVCDFCKRVIEKDEKYYKVRMHEALDIGAESITESFFDNIDVCRECFTWLEIKVKEGKKNDTK